MEKNRPKAKNILDKTTSQVRVLYAPVLVHKPTIDAHIRRSSKSLEEDVEHTWDGSGSAVTVHNHASRRSITSLLSAEVLW